MILGATGGRFGPPVWGGRGTAIRTGESKPSPVAPGGTVLVGPISRGRTLATVGQFEVAPCSDHGGVVMTPWRSQNVNLMRTPRRPRESRRTYSVSRQCGSRRARPGSIHEGMSREAAAIKAQEGRQQLALTRPHRPSAPRPTIRHQQTSINPHRTHPSSRFPRRDFPQSRSSRISRCPLNDRT